METATKKTARGANGSGRTRAYYGYSRNGCSRCKQQRVRCDEQHPECDRCVFRAEPGQKKQQVRRKQAQTSDAPAAAAPAPPPIPAQQEVHSPTQAHDFASSPRQQPQRQNTTPRSQHSPSSADGAQQHPLPSPMGTGTSTTSPTTQFTSSVGSPEPEMTMPHSVPFNGNLSSNPRNVAWANLFDHIPVPVHEFPEIYMGINNPLFAAQKALDGDAMLHSNLMVTAGLDGSWTGGFPSGTSMAMPSMMSTAQQGSTAPSTLATENGDDVEYISRTDGFPHRVSTESPPDDLTSAPSDGLDGLLRGRWPHLPSHTSLALDTTTRPSYHVESRPDSEVDENVSEVIFGHASPASEALQLAPVQGCQSSPSLSITSLNDISTVLVEFYFKVTAQVYSCYDSRMNPFRSAVVRTWNSSRIIYCTLQSMAAASLVRDFPEVASIGRQLRQEAAELLAKTTEWDANSMLAILMLGGTSSWHDPRDLGLPFFNQIAACLSTMPASTFGEAGGDRSFRFFRESMLYWEMLLAFVTDDDTISTVPDERLDSSERHFGPQSIPGPRVPHPWTGFCAETQLAVLKVGRLIRRQRKFNYAHRFASMAHINQLKKDMATARELEERLVNISHPTEQSVKDTEDRNTPVWHLLTLAEIIRNTGLVQIYHVFPDLLSARLRRERRGANGDYAHLGTSFQDDNGAADEPAITHEERVKWLTSYTLRSLEMMKTIPIESGTRDFQPFLLVALSSELRITKKRRPGGAIPSTVGGMGGASLPLHALLNLDMETVEVTRARGFIESRLNAFLHVLPPKPIQACLKIVKQTWVEMDQQAEARAKCIAGGGLGMDGEADVYWMDVMIQNGWETIMA
ncbi:hypothetical protein HMPREF1624_05851 [Sporothrix schenckii ATCC 58251]|uniref:Zn(2)-C6 fungal-type domain-containing protein n=1 Tax=Sporothrix schenckii (strain ATCC 58251 / de Perez 2211183) TaxID=1391915 RepID=U7PT84_SPOS1|nr:hypothetical protein HMPREF1624_05851 [Sporothrix schenckii ATCC 58251]